MIIFLLKKSSLLISLFAVLLQFTYSVSQSYAQQTDSATLGVAKVVTVKDKNMKDGTVLISTDKGPVQSNIPYDSHVIGVVSRDAAIILNSTGVEGVPVISTGTVYVFVSSVNGPIQKGDLLTTSTIPGVAVKASKDGFVLGNALEDYSSADPKQIDKIALDLDLHYFNSKPAFPGSLTDILKIAVLPTKESPAAVFKYLAAAGVTLASFILTFMTFGRTAAKGVEALGRNPAASRIIHLGIALNIGICVVITIVGLGVSFLILRL